MKKTFLLLAFLFALQALGQTAQFEIDLKKPVRPPAIDAAKKIQVTFKNCDGVKENKIKVSFKYKAEEPVVMMIDCGKPQSFDISKWAKTKRDALIEVHFFADEKEDNDKKRLDMSFSIQPDGKTADGNISTGPAAGGNGSDNDDGSLVPIFDKDFVDKSYFKVKQADTGKCDCMYPVVEYDPCCNSYTIIECSKNKKNVIKSDTLNYLCYNKYKNKGVVFRIKNFNMLKYDVTMSNEFTNSNTEMPELFATISTLMSSTTKIQDADDANIKAIRDELAKIIKLRQDLKAYIEFKNAQQDCDLSDFASEKQGILKLVSEHFKSLDIEAKYSVAKSNYIKQHTSADYDEKKFNEEIKKKFHLEETPDEIVVTAKKILNLLINTSFVYQYNVPQLQNADKITFKLGIQPKKDMNGAIHMTAQPIEVPIRGGWKIDFTTGFYYSSIRNESYELMPMTVGGVAINKIVRENASGDGKRTCGAAALMHIYPRLGDIQPALAFGVGTSLDLNYSFLLGGGIILGKENRFALTGGVNYSNIKVLSKSYSNPDGTLINLPADAKSVNTFNRFKQGLFFSVTYSLGLTKKTQEASKEAKSDDTEKKTDEKSEDKEKEEKK